MEGFFIQILGGKVRVIDKGEHKKVCLKCVVSKVHFIQLKNVITVTSVLCSLEA